jgi:hypothetical protein
MSIESHLQTMSRKIYEIRELDELQKERGINSIRKQRISEALFTIQQEVFHTLNEMMKDDQTNQ